MASIAAVRARGLGSPPRTSAAGTAVRPRPRTCRAEPITAGYRAAWDTVPHGITRHAERALRVRSGWSSSAVQALLLPSGGPVRWSCGSYEMQRTTGLAPFTSAPELGSPRAGYVARPFAKGRHTTARTHLGRTGNLPSRCHAMKEQGTSGPQLSLGLCDPQRSPERLVRAVLRLARVRV